MKNYPAALLISLLATLVFLSIPSSASQPTQDSFLSKPIHHISLRIHLGNSQRPPNKWLSILEEINHIWLSQAGICFEMHTVTHDEELENGMDLWFESTIPDWNGYFTDMHDIHVRDNPDLRPAEKPARSSAARTAAHELGHALSLSHRQDSDDNLMRSKTYGWQLNQAEILQARNAVKELAISSIENKSCNPPALQPMP